MGPQRTTAFADWVTDPTAAPAAAAAPTPGGGMGGGQTGSTPPWQDWAGGGIGGDSGSPLPVVVRCPISYDAAAAQVTLPSAQKPGYSVTAFVGIDGGFTGADLPTAVNARLLDDTTVLVKLTGAGATSHGPEYTPAPTPGQKRTAVPVPPGKPYVAVVVFPAAGGMGGGQPITKPGMEGGQP